MTDREIIDRVLNGETDLFRKIINAYQSQVAGVIYGMLGQVPEAEDVGQETFIRFYKNLKNFRGDAGIATYLTRIAINLSLNEIKRRKRKNMLFSTNEIEKFNISDKSELNKTNLDKKIIFNAIQRLSPKLKSVVVLRLVEEYSTKETAAILKIPLGTVLSRLARAQEQLKEILSPQLEVDHG